MKLQKLRNLVTNRYRARITAGKRDVRGRFTSDQTLIWIAKQQPQLPFNE